MFTQCPECGTLFKVTAEQLQIARGDVRCGDCACTFNAIESLTDGPPALRNAVAADDIDAEDVNIDDLDVVFEYDDDLAGDDFSADGTSAAAGDDDADTEDQLSAGQAETLEFDVPEKNWADFFIDANPSPGRAPVATADVARDGLTENESIASDEAPEGEEIPPWLREQPEESGGRRAGSRTWAIAIPVLLIALATQAVHYNRDALATNPRFGALIVSVYRKLDIELYPEWTLEAFRMRGSEVVGGTGDTLEIAADVEVVGPDPVGLPLVRVALRDRWANPVAGKVFRPDQYLRARDRLPPGADDRVMPGTIIPVNIRVVDPGTDAEGYELDVCLPHRYRGLRCQADRSPFNP